MKLDSRLVGVAGWRAAKIQCSQTHPQGTPLPACQSFTIFQPHRQVFFPSLEKIFHKFPQRVSAVTACLKLCLKDCSKRRAILVQNSHDALQDWAGHPLRWQDDAPLGRSHYRPRGGRQAPPLIGAPAAPPLFTVNQRITAELFKINHRVTIRASKH